MRRFVLMSIFAISLLLLLLFRRLSGVLLPLLVVILTLLSTLGMMALTGTAFTLITQILPSFLLAVGVGAAVHVLSIFYKHLQQTKDKEESIAHALGHSGLAITMTSLTTAAGLLSFAGADVAPIADMGLFAAVGVMDSLLSTIVRIPSLLAIFPVNAQPWNSAEQLAALLHEHHPMYRDVAGYAGRAVPLYKRAQITAADLHHAFGGRGPGRFDDLERLTLFADNLVPHVLRLDGVLDYGDELSFTLTPGEPGVRLAEPVPGVDDEDSRIMRAARALHERAQGDLPGVTIGITKRLPMGGGLGGDLGGLQIDGLGEGLDLPLPEPMGIALPDPLDPLDDPLADLPPMAKAAGAS